MKRLALLLGLLAPGCGEAKKAPPPREAAFDGERAYGLLKELCLIGPRNHGSVEKERAEAWIAERMKACGAEVSVHEFRHTAKTATGPSTFRNIVAKFRPGEARRVLVGTHYDTRSWADRDPDPANRMIPISGANDGGSGVAVMVALAEVFRTSPPPVGVDMIFFDGEDFGREGVWEDYFLGSRAWVRDHPDYRVEWGVILDMVGDAALKIRREGASLRHARAVVDRVWAAARRADAKAFVEEDQPEMMDDHRAFLEKGIPVILLIDFEYPFFHTDEDTPDKCSAGSLGQVGRAVLEAVRGQ